MNANNMLLKFKGKKKFIFSIRPFKLSNIKYCFTNFSSIYAYYISNDIKSDN